MNIEVYENWNSDEPQPLGTLSIVSTKGRDAFAFEYANEYLKNHHPVMLDPELIPYPGKQYAANGLFGIFQDICPDRWGRTLIQRRELLLAEKEGRKPRTLTDMDYLLGVYDEGRMGGLRLWQDGKFVANDAALATPPWVSLRELEALSRDFELAKVQEHWIDKLLAPGSSLGGARPKANVKAPDGSLWIAKFPSKHDDVDVGAWEKVVHDLGQACGLTVPESKLERFSEYGSTFLVKRFDRSEDGQRIHFASAMTMLNKRDGDDGSYFDIVDFIRGNSINPRKDLQELWQRIAFSMAVSNHDDHFRNHGFLLQPNGWTLAPAYDINPVPYADSLSLTVDGRDSRISAELLCETAPFFDVSKPEERIEDITQIVSSNWVRLATQYGISRHEQQLMAPSFTKLRDSYKVTKL